MPTWPATLPQLGQIGAGYKPQDAVARSPMDAGSPSRRNRFTAITKDVNYQMPLTGVQAAILEDFHENTLRNGALSFDWISPLTGRPSRSHSRVRLSCQCALATLIPISDFGS